MSAHCWSEQEPYAPFLQGGDVRSGSKACCIFNESLTYSVPLSQYLSCQCLLHPHLHGTTREDRMNASKPHRCFQESGCHPALVSADTQTQVPFSAIPMWRCQSLIPEPCVLKVLAVFIMALFPLWHLIDWYNGFYRLFINLLQQWINTTSLHA